MRKGSILIIIMAVLLSGGIFTACDNDGYSLDKFYVSVVTVKPQNDNQYYLRLDNGATLYPISGNPVDLPVKEIRAIANYTIVGDSILGYSHAVIPHLLIPILTKAPTALTPETADSLGYDPIRILNYGIADDYLNIHFAIPAAYGSTHFLNLAKNDTIGKDNYYELKHNAMKIPGPFRQGIVAFDLRRIKATHASPYRFTVKAQDEAGVTKEFTIVYDWEEGSSQMFSVLNMDVNYNKIMEVK